MANRDQLRDSTVITLEKERQKTKRYLYFLLAFGALAVIGIVVVMNAVQSGGKGGVELDLSKGKLKFNVDKPIVEQAAQPTKTYNSPQGDVQFTTGKIDSAIVQQLQESVAAPILPDRFTGKNLVNKEAGFLLTVENPQAWKVDYNAAGMTNPVIPVNTITAADGSHLSIGREPLPANIDIETYVTASVQNLMAMGLLAQFPDVTYDRPSQTPFLLYSNPLTGGQSYMKLIVNDETAYAVSANTNVLLSDPQTVRELEAMVGSFTLIGT